MGADPASWIAPIAALVAGYLIGSIPFAYIIVKLVTGEDVTEHGSGNIGSMNVRRTTGSWRWFVVAMLLDGLVKGAFPLVDQFDSRYKDHSRVAVADCLADSLDSYPSLSGTRYCLDHALSRMLSPRRERLTLP